jgi:activator of HSP90 ATPase
MKFTLKTIIPAKPQEVYSAWLNSEEHSYMTGGEAVVSNKVDETFTAWDGYIEGRNIQLELNKRIIQSWRTSEFDEKDEDSQLEVLFNDISNGTELTLIHTNLSDNVEQYKKGWEEHYFEPMKVYFQK